MGDSVTGDAGKLDLVMENSSKSDSVIPNSIKSDSVNGDVVNRDGSGDTSKKSDCSKSISGAKAEVGLRSAPICISFSVFECGVIKPANCCKARDGCPP